MKHLGFQNRILLVVGIVAGVVALGQIGLAQDERRDPRRDGGAPEDVQADDDGVDDGAAADDAGVDGEGVVGEAVAEPAPPPATDKWNDPHSIARGNRFYISWPKVLAVWLLFLVWVKTVDWVNRDSQIHDMGYGLWNAVIFFPFFAILFLVMFSLIGVPTSFVLGISLLSVAYLATFIPYVVIRNKSVERHQKVFTVDWFRYESAQLAGKVGIKISAERKAEYEKGAAVDLVAMGGKEDRDNQANLITARQSPGYLAVKELIADMAAKRSDRAILDYSQQAVTERHHIDGVWHNGETRDRESGDVMLAVMKTLANLDMTERRKKQGGAFAAKYKNTPYVCPIVCQGVKTGERVVLELLGGVRDELKTFDQLGMRDKLAEQWSQLMLRDKGLLIFSGLPEGGVTTMTNVALMETDRLMRDFISVEDELHREREIENVEVMTYNSGDGAVPKDMLVHVIRKYPNVVILRDLVDAETAKMLFDEVRDDRLVITTVHAKDAPETLLRMLQKKVPHRDFAALVTAVLNTRLVRKLCDQCKVGYEPAPELLKKLGIPAGKVEVLYRTPKPEEIEKPCPQCAGMGYFGRTGVFELLEVDSKVREVLVKSPKLSLVQQAARAAGMRTLQEEGILLVAKGVTSIQELQRVLKQ
jgi:type II secretory ATPase GspE/PulE/Tfp pilus assembly ATPase PilB-like protein